MNQSKYHFSHSVIILITLAFSACTSLSSHNWQALNGQVVDNNKSEAIGDAMVVALWRGTAKIQGQEHKVCYHVEVAKSDANGHFTIPAWQEQNNYPNVSNKSSSIIVYKSDYWTENVIQEWPAQIKKDWTLQKDIKFYLDPVSEKNQQTESKNRLKYLQKTIGLTGCTLDPLGKKRMSMLYSAVLKEAKKVAVTDVDKNIVRSIDNWASFVSE